MAVLLTWDNRPSGGDKMTVVYWPLVDDKLKIYVDNPHCVVEENFPGEVDRILKEQETLSPGDLFKFDTDIVVDEDVAFLMEVVGNKYDKQ